MLVQFSVRNFKTFKDRATLNLLASNYDKTTRENDNIFTEPNFNLRILKSAVIYGPNASGKSKFMEALSFMRDFVVKSSKDTQKGDEINVEPFRLQKESEKDSTEFEAVFIFDGEMFRYGFEVTIERVISEWLYARPKTKEIELFYRDNQEFDIHSRNFSKGNTLKKQGLVRENALMISVAAQFNDKNAGKVLDWFGNIGTISGIDEKQYRGYTFGRTKNPKHKQQILDLLKAADIGIKNLKLLPLEISNIPKTIPKEVREVLEKELKEGKGGDWIADVLMTRPQYDAKGKFVKDVEFSLDDDESYGTQKFIAISGPIMDTLECGSVLVVDELDSKLHPNLVRKLTSLFNSKELNPNNAQLIFNTHNTNLLDPEVFRRDQIWFTEKDKFGAAKLYSLSDIKSDVRRGEDFQENYLKGKYGAIPFLAGFDSFVNAKNLLSNEDEK